MLIWQREHAREELKLLLAAAVLGLALSVLLPLFLQKRALRRIAVVGSLAVLVPILFSAILFAAGNAGGYATAPETKADRSALFAGHDVMVIVPHQDDEINLAGGVIEEYVRAGSRVRVVYATNGDYFIPADERVPEAVSALSVLGVPAENMILMGYGSGTAPGGTLLIDALSEPMTSHAGHSAAYGAAGHTAWNEGAPYTHGQFVSDLADILLTCRPDVILVNGADPDPDHHSVSRMFEEAAETVLNEDAGYRPVILRGFAYSDGWSAAADFESGRIENLPTAECADPGRPLSFPVSGSSVSLLSAEMTTVGRALACHRSQDISRRSERLVNGNKLFYLYRTDEYSAGSPAPLFPFYKFTDPEGNYLYDCLTDRNGCLSFSLTENDAEDAAFTVSADDPACTVTGNGSFFEIVCPRGKSCTVTAATEDGTVLDSFRVTNFPPIHRFFAENFDSLTRFAPDQLIIYYRELARKIDLALHR